MTKEEAIYKIKTAFDVWEDERDCGYSWSEEHDARDLAVNALEIAKELADMEYIHNFQREAPWVVDFCHKLTDIQRRAKEMWK